MDTRNCTRSTSMPTTISMLESKSKSKSKSKSNSKSKSCITSSVLFDTASHSPPFISLYNNDIIVPRSQNIIIICKDEQIPVSSSSFLPLYRSGIITVDALFKSVNIFKNYGHIIITYPPDIAISIYYSS